MSLKLREVEHRICSPSGRCVVARTPKVGPSSPPGSSSGSPDSSTGFKSLKSHEPKSNGILAGLPVRELNLLMPHLHHSLWGRGQIFFDVARPLDYLYFPESGMVCMYAVVDDGRAVALAAVGWEGLVGVAGFLGAKRAHLRAIVLVEGCGFRLGLEELHRILPSSPQFAAALRRYSASYLMQIVVNGACHALHNVQQRIASWLLMARDRTGSDSLPFTHESLSELLGCRRSSVTKSLTSLQDAGAIGCGRGQIAVLDATRLSEQACECYDSLQHTTNW